MFSTYQCFCLLAQSYWSKQPLRLPGINLSVYLGCDILNILIFYQFLLLFFYSNKYCCFRFLIIFLFIPCNPIFIYTKKIYLLDQVYSNLNIITTFFSKIVKYIPFTITTELQKLHLSIILDIFSSHFPQRLVISLIFSIINKRYIAFKIFI